jgi:hypothetical protein
MGCFYPNQMTWPRRAGLFHGPQMDSELRLLDLMRRDWWVLVIVLCVIILASVRLSAEADLVSAFDATEASTALRLYLILACCAARGESVTIDALMQRAKKAELRPVTGALELKSKEGRGSSTPSVSHHCRTGWQHRTREAGVGRRCPLGPSGD